MVRRSECQRRGTAFAGSAGFDEGLHGRKGYWLVPADQAEATREQFAAITAQKQAQAAPPPPAQQPRKTAAVKTKMPPVQPASLTTPQN